MNLLANFYQKLCSTVIQLKNPEYLKSIPTLLALKFAGFLGTGIAFWLCNLVWFVGWRFPQYTLMAGFVSQTIIQLVALPAIQIQTVFEARKAEVQNAEYHRIMVELLDGMKTENSEIQAIQCDMISIVSDIHDDHQELQSVHGAIIDNQIDIDKKLDKILSIIDPGYFVNS